MFYDDSSDSQGEEEQGSDSTTPPPSSPPAPQAQVGLQVELQVVPMVRQDDPNLSSENSQDSDLGRLNQAPPQPRDVAWRPQGCTLSGADSSPGSSSSGGAVAWF